MCAGVRFESHLRLCLQIFFKKIICLRSSRGRAATQAMLCIRYRIVMWCRGEAILAQYRFLCGFESHRITSRPSSKLLGGSEDAGRRGPFPVARVKKHGSCVGGENGPVNDQDFCPVIGGRRVPDAEPKREPPARERERQVRQAVGAKSACCLFFFNPGVIYKSWTQESVPNVGMNCCVFIGGSLYGEI